jgi:hypothetical protein
VLEDLDTGVDAGSPTASDAPRPRCSGGEDDALRSASTTTTTRSPSATSTPPTWRIFRCRVSLGAGATATRRSASASASSPAPPPRRPPGWAREVDARAGDAGVDVEAGSTEERWNADLERFHHDGIVTRGWW